MLGPMTEEQKVEFALHPTFNGLRMPDIGVPETLDQRYFGIMDRKAINFMK